MNWTIILWAALISGPAIFGGLGFAAITATPSARADIDFRGMFKITAIVWIALMAMTSIVAASGAPDYLNAMPVRKLIATILVTTLAFAATAFYFTGSKKAVLALAVIGTIAVGAVIV